MVEIGGRPILWHIMKHYAHHGFNEFVVALGYKGEDIKRYFLDYLSLSGDLRSTSARGRSSRTTHRARGLDRPPGRHRRRDRAPAAASGGSRLARRRDRSC